MSAEPASAGGGLDDRPTSGDRGPAPAYGIALAILALCALLFAPLLGTLAMRWQSAVGESHGWLVALAIPVLIVARRRTLAIDGHRSTALPLAAVCASSAAMAMAHAAGIDVVEFLALPALCLSLMWLILGDRSARGLAGPVLFFTLATPVWTLLAPALQWLTVKASGFMIAVVGVRAYVQDSLVTVPAGTFEIAGGCSGEHFFVVALAVAGLFALTERLRPRDTLRLVGAAVLMALVTNWIRVSVIIIIGEHTHMRSPLVRDHNALGWWMFAVALVPLLIYARRLAAREGSARVEEPPAVRARPLGARIALALAGLALAPVWVHAIDARGDRSVGAELLPALPGWRGPVEPSDTWRPVFDGASSEAIGAYRRAGAEVDAYTARYTRQLPGRKLIGYMAKFADDTWEPLTVARRSLPDGTQVDEREYARRGGRRLVWSWYEVRGRRLLSPAAVKALQAVSAFGPPNESGVVALSAECATDCTAARGAMAAAYRDGLASIQSNRPRAGGE